MRLPDTATLTFPTKGSRTGGHNKPSVTWGGTTTEPCWFQEQNSTEQLENRDVTVTRGVLFGPAGSVITSVARVELASLPGVKWQVVGDPSKLTGFSGGLDHTETIIQKIMEV